jgi:hypothetical protein
MARLVLAVGGLDGHRREYIALFEDLARSSGVDVSSQALTFGHIFQRAPLFSPMLEEHTARFALIAAVRGALGLRSSALIFRPAEAARSTALKHRLKKLMLNVAQMFPTTSILTILPFSLDPAFATVAKGWIYDPQLWDWSLRKQAGSRAELAEKVEREAKGRLIVTALGAQNESKGFDFLAALLSQNAALAERFLFIAGGKVASGSRAAADAFEAAGGLLIDRFITDEELRALYDVSHMVWACYAPSYDQASGILGRAVQVGAPTLVRRGSFVERLAEELDHRVVALDWDDENASANALLAIPADMTRADPRVKVTRMRSESLATLGRALGLSLEGRGV